MQPKWYTNLGSNRKILNKLKLDIAIHIIFLMEMLQDSAQAKMSGSHKYTMDEYLNQLIIILQC